MSQTSSDVQKPSSSSSAIRRARFDDVNCVMYVNGSARFQTTELSNEEKIKMIRRQDSETALTRSHSNLDHNETAIKRLRKENHNLKKTLSRRWSSRSRSSMVSHMLTDDEDQDDADDSLYLLRETSTLHGLRDVLLSSSGRLRSIWVMIVFLAIILTLHGCYQIILEFSNDRIVVSYFIHEAEQLELPDIVVCPYNRFNASFLKEHDIDFEVSQYLELAYPADEPVFPSLNEKWFNIRNKYDELDYKLELLLEKLGNISLATFFRKAALKCEAFFGEERCANISTILTSAGTCYRVEMGNQLISGYSSGSRLVINLPEDEYNAGLNQMLNEGVIIKLAERKKGIDNDLTFIPAGVHAIMPLLGTSYEFMNTPPKYECDEDLYSNYSRVWCFENCLTHEAQISCQCSPAASQQPMFPDNLCSGKDLDHCFMPRIMGDWENITARCKKECKAPCKSWSYGSRLSYSPLTTKRIYKNLFENDEEFKKLKRTIILDVYYSALDYTCIKHVIAMPLQSLIAQIGGQFSLWAGGSLISLCQIVIYLTRFFISKCGGCQKRSPAPIKKVLSNNENRNKQNGKLMNVEVVKKGSSTTSTATNDRVVPPL